MLYVGGGNTANLLAVWRVHGLDAIVREAWEAGVVLAGISAGMICWFQSSFTDSFGGELAPLHDGLGILPGSACPHYDGEAERRPGRPNVLHRNHLLWLLSGFSLALAGCNTSAPRVTFVHIGQVQAAVEQHAGAWDKPNPKQFHNVLDYVATALAQRMVPAQSFTALRQRAAAATKGRSGQAATDAGIRAMLGKSGWLLDKKQTQQIQQMMAARKIGKAGTAPRRSAAPLDIKQISDNCVYLGIPTFEDATIGRRAAAVLDRKIDNGVNKVIIDLRNNPGGRPEQANTVADVFIDAKPLQIFQFADGSRIVSVAHSGAKKAAIAVLINANTGSAAEMLAMALKEDAGAILVGQATAGALYGKDGLDLPDGRIIIFRCEPTVLSPEGIDYSERGIPPDIKVASPAAKGDDPALATAISALHAVR